MKTLYILMTLSMLTTAAVAAEGKPVRYAVNGKTFEGYYVSPAAGAPLVFLVHDWDGLTDYEVKRAQMLADLGYAVFAVDLFGAGVRPTQMEERQRLTNALYEDRQRLRTLLEGSLEAARANRAQLDNAVAMGYCFGGAVVLELARSGADFKGFVTFHGGLTTPDGQDYGQTRGKILVLHGSADTSVTLDDFADLARQLERQAVTHEMITYSGAPHAFTVFGSDRYRAEADRLSWARFTAFLQENLR